MTRTRALAAVLALAVLPGCKSSLAFMIAKSTMSDQQSVESYRGRYVEHLGIDAVTGKDQVVVREIVYDKPGKWRIEVVEPEERKGELLIYDGSQMILWRARDHFGMRVRGATPPTFKQLRALVYEDVRWSWDNFHTWYRGKEKQVGRKVHVWRSYPIGDKPYYRYESWLDADCAIPLKTWIRDTRVHEWYSMEFQQFATHVPVDPGEFSFTFPEDAIVVDWDLSRPGVAREEFEKSLNFELKVPTDLPASLEIEKILPSASGTPGAVVVMRHKARVVTLGEMQSMGRTLDLGPGLTIKLDDEIARLNFMGNFTSINWYAGNTAMFLVGNLPYPQLVEMARKLTPRAASKEGLYSLKSYRGTFVEECPGRDVKRVVREVVFEAPVKFRIEVKEPAERAGEVSVYDGATLTMWSPHDLVAVRVTGKPAPTAEETRKMLTDRALWALRNYDVSYVKSDEQAGRRADLWKSVPKKAGPWQFSNDSWLDATNAVPLKADLRAPDGHLLCSTGFTSVAFDSEIPKDAFSLSLPAQAIVFDQDLSGPGVTEEDLKKASNFEFLKPSVVPAELTAKKLVKGPKGGPVATLLMEGGASWLSLTEARHFAAVPKSWTSVPIAIGERTGSLDVMSNVSTVSWSIGNTSLTLTGNLPLNQVLEVAASVSPLPSGEPGTRSAGVVETYRGRIVEHTASGVPVVREVVYKAPDKVSVKVVEPKSRAGERVVWNGTSLSMWWPQQLFGVSSRGAPAPTESELREALAQAGRWAWRNNAIESKGFEQVAGRAADRFALVPSQKAPLFFPSTLWLDQASSLPLKGEQRDAPDHVWYSMEFESVEVNVPVDDASFAFAFPPNAVTFEFDLRDPDRKVDELQRLMNFKLLVPGALPEGLKVSRIVKGRHQLPMALVYMSQGARWLSLTEVRRTARALDKDTGIPVQVGSNQGYLNMLGGVTSVTWLQGDTALTLVGNLPLPEVVLVAASVGAPEKPTAPGK